MKNIFYFLIFFAMSCSTQPINITPSYTYNGAVIYPIKDNGSLHVIKENFVYQDERVSISLIYWSDGNVQLQVYRQDAEKKFENIDLHLKAP